MKDTLQGIVSHFLIQLYGQHPLLLRGDAVSRAESRLATSGVCGNHCD